MNFPFYGLIIFSVLLIHIITIIVILLLENRNPYKTIAWILALIFLPGLGLILYYFIGENIKSKFYSLRYKRKKYNKIVNRIAHEQKQNLKSFDYNFLKNKSTLYLALESSNYPFSKNNNIQILNNGKEFYPKLFEVIENAKNHIHMEYFIFREDYFVDNLVNLLIKKSKENVKIRILVDGLGAINFSKKYKKIFKQNHIEFGIFLPVQYSIFRNKLNYRNHRKICVVDGQIGFIGGINIGKEYLDGGKKYTDWRDMQFMIKGKAVYSLQTIFVKDWAFVKKENIYSKELYPKINNFGDSVIHITPSGPDLKWSNNKFVLFSLITNSEKKLYIQTPYFIPDETLLFALKSASLKGVDVKIILPQKSDSLWVDLATKTYFSELMSSGIKIYLYQKGFLHNKLVISDDVVAIGSTNLDSRSLDLDFEVTAFVFNSKFSDNCTKIYLNDLNETIEQKIVDLRKQSFFTKFKQSFARLLSPLL